MFGIGMSEMVIILAVALLVFGPQKLPEIAKGLAKGLRDLRKAGDDLRASIDLDDEGPRHRPPRRAPAPAEEPPAQIAGSALTVAPAEGTQAQGSLESELAREAPAPSGDGPADAPPGEAKGS